MTFSRCNFILLIKSYDKISNFSLLIKELQREKVITIYGNLTVDKEEHHPQIMLLSVDVSTIKTHNIIIINDVIVY